MTSRVAALLGACYYLLGEAFVHLVAFAPGGWLDAVSSVFLPVILADLLLVYNVVALLLPGGAGGSVFSQPAAWQAWAFSLFFGAAVFAGLAAFVALVARSFRRMLRGWFAR